jgi:LmbE family N-acetylglucosaminyl deacetylase
MNVLVVGCHPADLEICCGGTIAKYSADGYSVTCCNVADGSMGHVEMPPDEMREVRLNEARQSIGLLGAALISIGARDLQIDAKDPGLVKRMVKIIRDTQPDIIITHSPDDYMSDHVEVSKLVCNASFSAGIPQYEPNLGEACGTAALYYMDTQAGIGFHPQEYVDITPVVDLKLAALSCHASQIKFMYQHDRVDFLDYVRTCAKYRGFQCGAPFAEAFVPYNAWPRLCTGRLLP